MRLWTIQTQEAWHNFQESGKIRADSHFMDSDFKHAYLWMVTQMELRLSARPKGVDYPVWAWLQWDGQARLRPDLRASAHLPRGTKGVRIEFSIPDSMALLSDFELWHYALNNWYLPLSEQDALAFEAEFPGFHANSNVNVMQIVKESWDKIFDLEWCDPYIASKKSEKSIQAALWEIDLKSVSEVSFFVAR